MKVTELLKFQKLHFSGSISFAILAWSSKLMVDYDNMGPSLQLIRERFLNLLLSKLSRDFKLCGMSILRDFQRAIFPYCWTLESRGQVCWQSYMYCTCWYDLDPIQGQVHVAMTVSPLPELFLIIVFMKYLFGFWTQTVTEVLSALSMGRCGCHLLQSSSPCSSSRQHWSSADCLEDKREDSQNCSVLCCMPAYMTIVPSNMHTREQFLSWMLV